MADTDGLIMTAVVITGGSTLVAEQQSSTLSFKPIVGAWLLGLFLFIIATFDTDIARAFAVLVMVTALLINGTKVFSTINKATGTVTITGHVGNTDNPATRKIGVHAV